MRQSMTSRMEAKPRILIRNTLFNGRQRCDPWSPHPDSARSPDHRLAGRVHMRIFVSSTFEDLREHRAAAIRVLRQLGHEVFAMEDMVAGPSNTPLARVIQMIDRSDAYVGIFAWRYGYIPPRPRARPSARRSAPASVPDVKRCRIRRDLDHALRNPARPPKGGAAYPRLPARRTRAVAALDDRWPCDRTRCGT